MSDILFLTWMILAWLGGIICGLALRWEPESAVVSDDAIREIEQ